MSSLRNSLHRPSHKERSQLSHRAKLGILEKHSDYVLRARDYHSKRDRIKRLKQKVADRNKDEFYFGMVRQKTQGGVHIQDRGNDSMPEDLVKILKTQDENYVRTMRAVGLKKIEKLKAQLTALVDLIAPHLLKEVEDDDEEELDETELDVLRQAGIIPPSKASKTSKRSVKHFIFVDSEEEAKKYASDLSRKNELQQNVPTSTPETSIADLGWKELKPSGLRKGKGKQMHVDPEEEALKAEERRLAATEHRSKLLKELSARLIRDRQLRYAERELEMQRMLMGQGGRMKVRGVEKVGGEDEDDDLDEDELDSMKIKKSDRIKAKNDQTYKPRVYKWRLERKK